MEVSVVGGGTVYIYYQDGQITALAPENVIHWKGLGNGYMGLSKLEFMRSSMNESIRAQENANNLFGKGSKPTGRPADGLQAEPRADGDADSALRGADVESHGRTSDRGSRP